jgi:hypothetical protein
MLKTGIALTDRIEVPTQRQITDAGQMIVPCAFARIGSQKYYAKQLGLVNVDENEIVEVFRDEADVFDEDSMSSFRSSPVTIGHPKVDGKTIQVTADNAKDYQVGMLEGLPTRDEDLLTGTIVVSNKEAIDAIEGGDQELSAGYTCDLEMVDEDGVTKFYQRNIRANHIAIVAKGRAGSSCRLADEDLEDEGKEAEGKEAEGDVVSEETVVSDEVLDLKVTELTDALEVSDAALDVAKAKLAKLESFAEAVSSVFTFDEEAEVDVVALFDQAVKDRCAVIQQAKDITDLEDFEGKSVQDIKGMVVADLMPDLDLKDRDEAYINARFEILCEDSELETPMSKVLRKQVADNAEPAPKVDPVKEARQRSIERNK